MSLRVWEAKEEKLSKEMSTMSENLEEEDREGYFLWST